MRGGGPGGGPGQEVVGDDSIYINGGTTVITVTGDLAGQGDGIDANGHVEMSGGVVVVNGPTDTRNSAVDYSGGSFQVNGGLFIGTNTNGRNSEGVGAGSTQASIYLTSSSVLDAGTVIHLQTTNGEDLVTFQPVNDFDVIVFTSPDLVTGEAYEVYPGGSVSGDSATGLYEAYAPGDPVGDRHGRLENCSQSPSGWSEGHQWRTEVELDVMNPDATRRTDLRSMGRTVDPAVTLRWAARSFRRCKLVPNTPPVGDARSQGDRTSGTAASNRRLALGASEPCCPPRCLDQPSPSSIPSCFRIR